MNKALVMYALIFAVLTTVVGCEASKGLGKDVENTGKNIQETVDKNQ